MLSVQTCATLDEAARQMGDRTRFLAGGTLVMRGVNYADPSFDRIVRARTMPREIRSDGTGLRIGAGATMADLLAARDAEILHPVARMIGGPAVRNMATVGGNLFAAHPYGDLATALLALDARVEMAGGGTEPMETFLAGRDRQRGLVTAVILPRATASEFRWAKVSRVKPKGVSMLSIAAWLQGGSRITDARIAFGGMGPTPLRAKAAERALRDRTLDPAGIEGALAACLDGLAPADDALASEWYRREVAPVHLRRLLLREAR